MSTFGRCLMLLPLWAMLTSAAPAVPLDVNETGRVMATLNDWRALMLVMLAIITVLVGALLWAFGKLAKTVEVMVTLRETISALNDTARAAGMDARENRNDLSGITATLARIEADMATRRR